jgi:hypothetical protein
LIRKSLDLVDVVQKVVVLLYLACEKLAAKEDDVGQTLRLVNVAKTFPHLRRFFATLDVHKLVVRQVEANDRHSLLNAFLILLLHFGFHIEWWRFFGSVHNVPKIHGYQQYFDFKLPKVGLPSIELVNDSNGLAIK